MSMKMRITRDDFLKGKLVTPGWYTAKIADVVQETSKKGDSQNFVITFQILDEGEFKDVKPMKTFNEKAPGVAIPFFTACNGGIQIAPDADYDFAVTKGRTIQIMITNEPYNNRMVNSIVDYRTAE